MSFLPDDFDLPEVVQTPLFRLRSITMHDAEKYFDAVSSSQAELWEKFSEIWGWPTADLTVEQDTIDLGWHQKEFQLRSSFNYAVMALDESQLLGCVYIDPADSESLEAEITLWVRTSELPKGLELELEAFVSQWLKDDWPFDHVLFQGHVVDVEDL